MRWENQFGRSGSAPAVTSHSPNGSRSGGQKGQLRGRHQRRAFWEAAREQGQVGMAINERRNEREPSDSEICNAEESCVSVNSGKDMWGELGLWSGLGMGRR